MFGFTVEERISKEGRRLENLFKEISGLKRGTKEYTNLAGELRKEDGRVIKLLSKEIGILSSSIASYTSGAKYGMEEARTVRGLRAKLKVMQELLSHINDKFMKLSA